MADGRVAAQGWWHAITVLPISGRPLSDLREEPRARTLQNQPTRLIRDTQRRAVIGLERSLDLRRSEGGAASIAGTGGGLSPGMGCSAACLGTKSTPPASAAAVIGPTLV